MGQCIDRSVVLIEAVIPLAVGRPHDGDVELTLPKTESVLNGGRSIRHPLLVQRQSRAILVLRLPQFSPCVEQIG